MAFLRIEGMTQPPLIKKNVNFGGQPNGCEGSSAEKLRGFYHPMVYHYSVHIK